MMVSKPTYKKLLPLLNCDSNIMRIQTLEDAAKSGVRNTTIFC